MSWMDLVLPGPKKAEIAPVVVSCNKPGRFTQALRITIRADRIEGGLAWWTPDAWVRVQLGSGEHAGMMRLSPGMGQDGPKHKLRLSGGKGCLAILTLRGFKPLADKAVTAASVEFDHGEEWLELMLPSWAISTAGLVVRPVPDHSQGQAPRPRGRPPKPAEARAWSDTEAMALIKQDQSDAVIAKYFGIGVPECREHLDRLMARAGAA